ncbi:MAG: sensor histidine kinase [Crocinitomicaceae bacterium]|nr:sensor histidine kinase [Crocinitomicaceae bacterium]
MAAQSEFEAQNKFTLVFDDDNLEREYRESYDAEVKVPLRYGIIISILSWYSGIALIYAVIPEKFSWLSTLTIIYIGSYFGFIIYATYKKRFKGYYHLLGAISNAWAGLYAIFFCHQFPNGENLALPVIIFIIFFGSYMVRLRWIAGFIAAFSYTLAYQIYILEYSDLTGSQIVFYAFVSWMVLIFALVAGRVSESNNRFAFVQAKTIREQKTIIETEKTFLLKEVHHRVKNNLQIIVSLINLQLSNATDQKSEIALKEVQSRVLSMSLVHQRMHQASNFTEISLVEYTNELVENLIGSGKKENEKVTLSIAPEILIDIDTAIPLGLIINEVVNNFHTSSSTTEAENCQLEIKLEKSLANGYKIWCRDEANSYSNDFETSFVFELVEIFVGQLDGELNCSEDNGLVYQISFPVS